MRRTLIIARFDPADADAIAEIFAESDATELPHMLNASSRTLFRFHDLYAHLIEADGDLTAGLDDVRSHPLFHDLNEKLGKYVRPYDPGWSGPRDAMANEFYSWRSDRVRSPGGSAH